MEAGPNVKYHMFCQYRPNKHHLITADVTPTLPYESSEKRGRMESVDFRDFQKIGRATLWPCNEK